MTGPETKPETETGGPLPADLRALEDELRAFRPPAAPPALAARVLAPADPGPPPGARRGFRGLIRAVLPATDLQLVALLAGLLAANFALDHLFAHPEIYPGTPRFGVEVPAPTGWFGAPAGGQKGTR